jgi:hypothetical protein
VDNRGGDLTSVDASGLSNTNFDDTAGGGLTYIASVDAETITLSAGNDVLVFNDIVPVVGVPTVVPAGSTIGELDTVFGFDSTVEATNSSTDVIRFGDDGGGGGASLNINGTGGDTAAAVDVTAATSLTFAFNIASQVAGTDLQTFQFGGSTYLFQDDSAIAGGDNVLNDDDFALRVDGLVDFTAAFTA